MKYALDVLGAAGGGTTSTPVVRENVFFGRGGPKEMAFLLAVRLTGTGITDTSGRLLDADFAGTSLDFNAVGVSPDVSAKTLFDALWDMNPGDTLTFEGARFAKKLLPVSPTALPAKGSGDGSPGGLFHSAFKVIPPSP